MRPASYSEGERMSLLWFKGNRIMRVVPCSSCHRTLLCFIKQNLNICYLCTQSVKNVQIRDGTLLVRVIT